MAVEITGDSPQAVAYKLFEIVALKEGKILSDPTAAPDKAWILSTYKECIAAVLDIKRWGAYSS